MNSQSKTMNMKNQLLIFVTAVIFLLFPHTNFAQAPTLGSAANFVLFSSVGAVSNTGISQITGNVGTNIGSSTGFGNVNGQMHDQDVVTGLCATDVLAAYNQLNAATPTFFPAPLLGNGQTLNAGVYAISGASTMNLNLTLDGQGNANAVFIFQIAGSFSSGAAANVILINNAQACNVFWKVEGLVSLAAGTKMRGTIIAHNAAIDIYSNSTLEGRALSTVGAVTVHDVLAYTPVGCGMPIPVGPAAPALGSTACYTIFSASGPVSNSGITHVTGDVGTNSGLTTGFNPLDVIGTIHPIPDVSTGACASDLGNVYNYLNLLPYDIELLYPAQFGRNLVLTPHTYIMNAATIFTDSLYLNALGNANAVFILKIYGALSTSTYSKVLLINGAQAKNVYWLVSGAVNIMDYSQFKGTIVCNNGAIDITTGALLEGRALATTGAISTTAITANMTAGCGVNPLPPPTITGNTSMCVNSGYFDYTTEPGMTNYVWTVSAGGIINYGSGTNHIQVSWIISGPQTVSVNYQNGAGFTSSNPPVMNISVNPAPGAIGAITGTSSVCAGTNGVAYSVVAIPAAVTYVWTLPANASIVAGFGTNNITVSFANNAVSGNILVYGNNLCGNGTSSVAFPVVVSPLPAAAGIITGSAAICEGTTGVIYSVAPISLATSINWSVPAGATIVAGANTNTITVDFGPTAVSGVITVSGANSCGNGTVSPDFNVMITAIPQAPVITLLGVELTSSAPIGNQWYFEGTAIAGATGQTWTALQSGMYSDVVTINGCVSESSIQINVVMVGVNEATASQFMIFPIPNNGQFTISMNSPTAKTFSIEIYNMTGNRIYEEHDILVLGEIRKVINLRPVSNGVYTVVLMNSESRIIRKVQIDN